SKPPARRHPCRTERIFEHPSSVSPPKQLFHPQQRNNAHLTGVSHHFRTATRPFLLRFEKQQKSPSHRGCCGVAFRKGFPGGSGTNSGPTLPETGADSNLSGSCRRSARCPNYLESLEAFGELVLGNGFGALAVFGPRSALHRDQRLADFLRR